MSAIATAVDLSVLRLVTSHYRLRLARRVQPCAQLPPSAKPRFAPRAAPLPWLAAWLLSHVTVLHSDRRADAARAAHSVLLIYALYQAPRSHLRGTIPVLNRWPPAALGRNLHPAADSDSPDFLSYFSLQRRTPS